MVLQLPRKKQSIQKPKLETENQQLHRRIQELEHTVEERPSQQWGNTLTQQATKALNKQIKLALEKTIDLRCRRRALTPSLAAELPKKNAQECLRLMGMALKNLASAISKDLLVENSVSGVEIKAVHEGEGSAASVPNPKR